MTGDPQTAEDPKAAPRSKLREWMSHDAPPHIQFLKYGFAGGVATAVDILITFLMSWLVFKALTPDDPLVKLLGLQVQPLDTHVQAMHYATNRGVSFIFSNMTAYILNVLFVFKRGRHHWLKEIGLFYLVSGISFVIGTTLGSCMIEFLHASWTAALIANLVASLLINYVCRKFIIFKG